MHLEPLRVTKDRHNENLNTLNRQYGELSDLVKDLGRDRDGHDLAIKQGLASIRSLFQTANRKMRETGMLEEKEELDPAPPGDNIAPVSPDRIRVAGGRHVI